MPDNLLPSILDQAPQEAQATLTQATWGFERTDIRLAEEFHTGKGIYHSKEEKSTAEAWKGLENAVWVLIDRYRPIIAKIDELTMECKKTLIDQLRESNKRLLFMSNYAGTMYSYIRNAEAALATARKSMHTPDQFRKIDDEIQQQQARIQQKQQEILFSPFSNFNSLCDPSNLVLVPVPAFKERLQMQEHNIAQALQYRAAAIEIRNSLPTFPVPPVPEAPPA